MPSVIVLVNAASAQENPEISDFYAVNTPSGQSIICFEDQEKLEEVRAAVHEWSKSDGLIAASINLDATTLSEAIDVLRSMFPPLGQMTFLSDDDPFVDQMLQHIRQMRDTG